MLKNLSRFAVGQFDCIGPVPDTSGDGLRVLLAISLGLERPPYGVSRGADQLADQIKSVAAYVWSLSHK